MSATETVENILKPGDVSCDELFLTTNDLTQYDFSAYMVEFILYEDLFSPTLTGEILVADAVSGHPLRAAII